MKILHISTRLILGGSQENTVLSCEGQARDGHDVHLAYGPIHGPEGTMRPRVEAFRTDDGRGITLHEVPDMIREVDLKRDRQCLRQLRQLIRELQPDIVHTHSSKAGVLGRLAAWREGGRKGKFGVVHTVHGPPFHDFESMKRNAIYIMAERHAAKRCHCIVTVCDMMQTQYLANRIGTDDQYRTVYSGVDLTPYENPVDDERRRAAREKHGLPQDAFVIGTVARIAELKGHEDLVIALRPKLRKEPSWHMFWVGDGWLRESLESRLRNEGMKDRVTITGMISSEQIPDAIAAMDVLVHPSYREGLPRVVVQAQLSGVPVVAHGVDGTPEAVLDPVTGRLVTAGDHLGLREAVTWVYQHREKALKGAMLGREACLPRFGAETMVRELQSVYDDVLASISTRKPRPKTRSAAAI